MLGIADKPGMLERMKTNLNGQCQTEGIADRTRQNQTKAANMKLKTRPTLILALIAVVCSGATCKPKPPPTTSTRVDYKLPTLTPVEPAKQDQEQEGIRISVAAYSYSTKQTVRREF